MSYGSRKDRKHKFNRIKEINKVNIKEFLQLAADQYVSDYPKMINDRAADRETDIDRKFLSAVAGKNFNDAYDSFQQDVNKLILTDILSDIMKQQMSINYNNVSQDMKEYFNTPEARSVFFDAVRAGIRRILHAPLQSGLSRTVLQKYLQKND